MMISYLLFITNDSFSQLVFQQDFSDLFDLVGLCQMADWLQIEDFIHIIFVKNMVRPLDSATELQIFKQLNQSSKAQILIALP